jgi:uncharacterized protein YjiS (DUF1127 family)
VSVIEHPSRNAHHIPASRTPRGTVAQLFLSAVRRWQSNRAIEELSRLDDRQLEDIGMSRNDIPRVVAGLFRPEEVPFSGRAPASTPETYAAGGLKPSVEMNRSQPMDTTTRTIIAVGIFMLMVISFAML